MSEYVMDIDSGGYDGNTFALCVIKKQQNGFMSVEQLTTMHDEKAFNDEVELAAKYYGIASDQIMYEK